MIKESTVLDDVLKYEQPTKYIVETENYDDSYNTPVLTAGKSFLLGYTNEEKGVFNEVPVIIFDDFTTSFHFVDFPFKVKSSALKILKAVKDKADIKYLYYKMQTIKFEAEQHKRYWISKYSQIEIPLPSIATQQRIAAILDQSDAIIQNNRAIVQKYDALTQSLFLDMFGDFRKNSNNFPKYLFDEIATKITDGDHLTPKREEKGYKLLSCRNIKNGYIDFSAGLDFVGESEFNRMFKRCNPEKGDILISCSGTIGRTTSIKIDEPFVLVRSAALVKPKRDLVDSLYLEYYLRTDYMQSVMKKSSNTSSQANLFTGPIKKLPIFLPPFKLQKQFAERVALIEAQKQQAQLELAKSEELFQSLLQKAFKGELN